MVFEDGAQLDAKCFASWIGRYAHLEGAHPGSTLWGAVLGGHIHHLQHVRKGNIRYGEPACLNFEALLLRCAALPRDCLDQHALQQAQHEIRMMWR